MRDWMNGSILALGSIAGLALVGSRRKGQPNRTAGQVSCRLCGTIHDFSDVLDMLDCREADIPPDLADVARDYLQAQRTGTGSFAKKVPPQLEAFYASLDDERKALLDSFDALQQKINKELFKNLSTVGAGNLKRRMLGKRLFIVSNAVLDSPLVRDKSSWIAAWKKPDGQTWEQAAAALDQRMKAATLSVSPLTLEPSATHRDKSRRLANRAWALEMLKVCDALDQRNRRVLSGMFGKSEIWSQIPIMRLEFKGGLPVAMENFPAAFKPIMKKGKVVYAPPELSARAACLSDGSRLYFFDAQNKPIAIAAVEESGKLLVRKSCNTASMTSKMAAPSFSLPAGPTATGGSCAAAGYQFPPGMFAGATYNICRSCYALDGNYRFYNWLLKGAPTLEWMRRLVSLGKPEIVAGNLAVIVESYARWETDKSIGSGRGTQELGVWHKGSIWSNFGVDGSSNIRIPGMSAASQTAAKRVPSFTITRLQKKVSSQAPKLLHDPTEGDPAGYFRIHDAGDFTVRAIKPATGGPETYIRGWGLVAAAYPHINFWVPTRIWAKSPAEPEKNKTKMIQTFLRPQKMGAISKQFTKHIRSQERLIDYERPLPRLVRLLAEVNRENLAIRPSALLVTTPLTKTPAPSIGGLDAGTSVNVQLTIKRPARSAQSLIGITQSMWRMAGLDDDTIREAARLPKDTTLTKAIKSGILSQEGVHTLQTARSLFRSWLANQVNSRFPETMVAGGKFKRYWPVEGHNQKTHAEVEAFQCPVYSDIGPDGRPYKSCAAAGCRFCWIVQELPATYGMH